jgi:hypothetical protein
MQKLGDKRKSQNFDSGIIPIAHDDGWQITQQNLEMYEQRKAVSQQIQPQTSLHSQRFLTFDLCTYL